MKTLFLNPPSFEGFDGGAGSRYQARREIRSFWYPTWLAQPAALVPNSKLLDCPPHDVTVEQCLAEARHYDHVILHTSTPSLQNDCRVAEAIDRARPGPPRHPRADARIARRGRSIRPWPQPGQRVVPPSASWTLPV